MNKKLFALLILTAGFFSQSNAQISIGNDTSLCSSSTVHLHAVTAIALGTTSYTFDTIPFNPYPYIGTVPYGSGNSGTNMPFTNCDDCATDSPVDLGFTFCFLGQQYTQCYIGTNGWISFSPNQPTTFTSTIIPNNDPIVPKNCIMGPWQDWYPGGGGNGGFVRDTTLGIAPNRVFVCSWIDCPMFSCTTTYGTFQIAIHEGTNVIDNYLQDKPNCLAWANGTATQGVHNIDGTFAYVNPGRNSTQWTATNEGTTFIPGGIDWMVNGSIIGYGADLDVTPTVTTTYIATVDLCNGNSYSDTMTITVGFGAVQFGQQNSTCPQASNGYAFFTPQDTTTWTYQWQNSAGTILGGGVTNQQPDTLFNLLPGQYTVLVSNSLGCTLTNAFNIQSNPVVFSTSSINSFCPSVANGNAIFSSPADTSTWSFVWFDSQNNILSTGTVNQSSDTLQNVFSGQYSVLITNAVGCTASHTVIVQADPFSASFNVSANPLCDQKPVNFSSTSIGTIDNYLWSFGDGGTSVLQSENHPYSPIGNYNVVLIISNSNGCIDTATATVSILPNIKADFSFSPSEGCVGSLIDFTDESNQFPISWDWNFGDLATDNIQNTFHAYGADGQYFVSLTVTDSLCGSDTKTIPVTIHFVPDVNIGNDTEVCRYETLHLNAGYPGTTYIWSTGETTQMINTPVPENDTYYSVIVNNFGCLGYDTLLAAINCDVFMPSGFSPNGDNFNDVFRPLGFRIVQYDMTVFNRWGEIIYQINSPNISNGWNGTFNGEEAEVGVYAYFMTATFVNGDKKSLTGNVTLLR